MVSKFSHHVIVDTILMSFLENFSYIYMKMQLELLKLHESILLLCSYPVDTSYTYVSIYKDYQDGHIKL